MHEQRHGLGLGLLIGVLLGLAVGAISLLAFSLMREDTLEKIKREQQNITVNQPPVNILPVLTPRPGAT